MLWDNSFYFTWVTSSRTKKAVTWNFLILYIEWFISSLTEAESQDEGTPREVF